MSRHICVPPRRQRWVECPGALAAAGRPQDTELFNLWEPDVRLDMQHQYRCATLQGFGRQGLVHGLCVGGFRVYVEGSGYEGSGRLDMQHQYRCAGLQGFRRQVVRQGLWVGGFRRFSKSSSATCAWKSSNIRVPVFRAPRLWDSGFTSRALGIRLQVACTCSTITGAPCSRV